MSKTGILLPKKTAPSLDSRGKRCSPANTAMCAEGSRGAVLPAVVGRVIHVDEIRRQCSRLSLATGGLRELVGHKLQIATGVHLQESLGDSSFNHSSRAGATHLYSDGAFVLVLENVPNLAHSWQLHPAGLQIACAGYTMTLALWRSVTFQNLEFEESI